MKVESPTMAAAINELQEQNTILSERAVEHAVVAAHWKVEHDKLKKQIHDDKAETKCSPSGE